MDEEPKTNSVFPCRFDGKRTAALVVFGFLFAPLSARGEWIEAPVEVTPTFAVSLFGTILVFAACSLLTGLGAWLWFAIRKPRNGKEVSDDEA